MPSEQYKSQSSNGPDLRLPLIKGRRATSHDVARLAGVSQSAVSRCFRKGASISAKMRDRVMQAAEVLEYRPNAIARGLITQRSSLVAILVSGGLNLYYPEALFRLTSELAQADLQALLFIIENEEDSERVIEQAWQFQIDGLISVSHMSLAQFQFLQKRKIPVVFFNRFFEDQPSNVVHCDPSGQILDLVERLVKFGHRRFGLINGPDGNMVGRTRAETVRQALRALKMQPASEAKGDFTYEGGSTALRELFAANAERPTAIISVNDMMAMGCIDEARSVLGLKVPEDMSIVGIDGIGMSQFASYELTTIRQPINRMCKTAVEMILAQIENPDQAEEKRVFYGALIEGSSVAATPDQG